jgi:chromosome segregation ATPase
LSKQKLANTSLQTEIDNLRGRPSEAGARTRDVSGRATPSLDADLQRKLASLQSAHTSVQAELSASRDVLAAREREVDLMRMRVEEAEREVEILREDLAQAQQRISTLLEMGGPNGFDMGSEDGGDHDGRGSDENSDEATMQYDKVGYQLGRFSFG